jgi:Sec7-like guanine-nucleotide exchange factor
VAVRRFNIKPRDGVAYLQQRGMLRVEAPAIAHFLRSTKGLSKRRLGDYLGERGEPHERVRALRGPIPRIGAPF